MVAVWLTGKLWLKVPQSLKFNMIGNPPKYVMSKDIILNVIGKIGTDGANYKACEFYGNIFETMSIDSKICISNQTMEAGAKTAIIPPNKNIINYLKPRTKIKFEKIFSDKNAEYEKIYDFDLTNIEPQVACPNSLNNIKPVRKMSGISIDQAVIGSCTNGRLEDLKISAKIIKGKKISKNVRMIVIPSSRYIYLEAIKKGYISILTKAGAVILNPGCGPCLGLHQGVVADMENVLSTTNSWFTSRSCCRYGKCFIYYKS
jgi:homoaconitase/3-isopropylmalate dehydratase large subunit